MDNIVGAGALGGALSRQEEAPPNDLSAAELRVALETATDLGGQWANKGDFENTWSNDNPDSWPYPD